MPVITLTLTWNPKESWPSTTPGWDFEISGRPNSIDMSSHRFVHVGSPPYRREGGKIIGDGPSVWVLTPDEQPFLGRQKGATKGRPPMAHVAKFLEALEGKGYHVTASHSAAFGGEDFLQTLTHIWTLKYAPPSSTSVQITA